MKEKILFYFFFVVSIPLIAGNHQYIGDGDFKELFQYLYEKINVEEGDNDINFILHSGLFYKLDNLCVPKGEMLQLIIYSRLIRVNIW